MIAHHRRFRAFARPHAMASGLVRKGHDVSLIVTSDHRRTGVVETCWDGVRVIETPDLLWGRLRSGWDAWNLLNRLAYLIKDQGPYDLVHCFETRPATIYPALFYCHRYGLPLITDWNDWWGRGGVIDALRPKWYRILFGPVETYYEEAFRTHGAGLTVISTALARRAMGLGVATERICYVPGGSFPNWFKARALGECRDRAGFPADAPVIGFSSMDSHLDLEIVVRALALLVKDYPTLKLMITGKARPSVLELARGHGVEDNVHLTGFLTPEDLPWYLGCADLFVLPFPETVYNVGRWPNKVGDYMSLGRPTVTNPVGDVKSLFERHEVGLLADYDPADFARKIGWLLENPSIARQLGANARQVAVTLYDWDVLVGTLEEFYHRVLAMESRKPIVAAA